MLIIEDIYEGATSITSWPFIDPDKPPSVFAFIASEFFTLWTVAFHGIKKEICWEIENRLRVNRIPIILTNLPIINLVISLV